LRKDEFLAKLVELGFSSAKANKLYEAIQDQHSLTGFPDHPSEMANHIATKIDGSDNTKKMELIRLLTQTGMSPAEAKRLVTSPDTQALYNKLAQFSNKPDFSHMMITGATELSNSPQFFANIAARGKTVRAAGWLGDTSTVVPLTAPNIDNGDYKSDLDAVNIVRRIQHGSGSFADTARHYYNEIDRGAINRAKEFQTHYQLDDIIEEINQVDGSGKQVGAKDVMGGKETIIAYDNSLKSTLNPSAKRFVNSLEQNSNEYIDEEPS